jgi:hypothetical protein
MLKNFGKETPKEMLKEGMENEGNAFTAGLAKAKKGEAFKVGSKTMKDKSNYDAPGVKETTINDEYPESWKMREDNNMEEGLNLPSPEMKATGQTTQTTEGDQLNRFSVLSPSEREQLEEYIQSIKTIKEEIKKLVSKTKTSGMEESQMGGNRTGLVMTKGGMQEDGGEEAEQTISPKLHSILEKLIAALRAEGLDDQDIQMLVKYEMEEAGKQAVAAQYDM